MARDRVIPSRPVQDLETLVNKKQKLNYNIKGDTPLRELNLSTVDLNTLANVVATLIKDLRS
jgi:hypothetical protein